MSPVAIFLILALYCWLFAEYLFAPTQPDNPPDARDITDKIYDESNDN